MKAAKKIQKAKQAKKHTLETILYQEYPEINTSVGLYWDRAKNSYMFRVADPKKVVQATVAKFFSTKSEFNRFISDAKERPDVAASFLVSTVPDIEDKFPEPSLQEGSYGLAPELDFYLKEISRYPLLDKQKEIDLSRKIKKGDKDALDKMVNSNLRLAFSVARKFYKATGADLFDLIQEANQGLILAAQKYNPSKARFSTYAMFWVRQKLLRHVHSIHEVPQHTYYTWRKIIEAEKLFEIETGGRKPTRDELVEFTKGKFKPYQIDLYLSRKDFMKQPSYNDDNFLEPGTVTDTESMSQLSIDLGRALIILNRREKRIIKMYYGFRPYTPQTLQQIGEKYDLSRERIRQILAKAERKLKNYIVGKKGFTR
ncbi:sigma-70 family RNA polymerase sigma factor [Candidatus Woesearchaeota archaeon]|nr:sigma-70 family RNA polymerase sigma factor [Candidatus Woesearchaeota archaeon]